ncbi:PAS domain S-box protein [Thermodesulfobacteriota bacterium]
MRDNTNKDKAGPKEIYRSIFEISPEAIILVKNGKILDVNSAWLALHGFKDKNEVLGKDIPEALSLDDKDTGPDLLKKLKISEKITYQIKNPKSDFHRITFELFPHIISFNGEDFTVATSHHSLQSGDKSESIRESEDKYKAIIEGIEDGYYEVDISGNFTFFNEAICEILGYPRDELAGINNLDYMDKENARKFYQKFNKVFLTGKPDKGIDWEFIRKDGSRRHVEASISLIKDSEGTGIGFRGILRDITERIQAEKALRESEERYRTILDSIEEAYFEVNLSGTFVFFNESLAKNSGYSSEELLKMNNRDYMPPETSKKIFNLFNHIYRTGKLVKKISYEVINKDGSHGFHELSASVIRDQEGNATGFRGISRDITELIKAEKESDRLKKRLAQAQKMEAIGTLAGGVAHDLNNILAGLVSYPELILIDLPEDSPLRKPVLTIKKSGEKAAAIVQDLLTLARRGVPITEPVDLNQIITEYLNSPEYEKLRFYHPAVSVKVNLKQDLLKILGSPVHLSKTVMNLVSNAAEAMPEGGEIEISTENQYINRSIIAYDHIEEGDYIVFKISDTGEGISPSDLERIFEPFFTKKTMGRSGTGLGMAVVWGTVKDHGGYVDVKSTVRQGTEFKLYFPVLRDEREKYTPVISMDEYKGRGETVLVVDDVEEQRDIASGMLEKLGYSVTTVPSGEDAVDYMKDNSAEILVLDMIMDPGIDGLDTFRKIKEFHPHQKAIIVSGFSETERVREIQKLGAGKYIRKPYTLEGIGIALRNELDKEI